MAFQGDSIFWVEVEKVVPNPFQPRREFDEERLQELADSIRMYGVLQPLTVTRKEVHSDDGAFRTEYELIAGERRLRASRLAGVAQVPVIIRSGEQTEQEKLELAIIENLQREDLNAVDRALAFKQLAEAFDLSHAQVAKKVGRSREYVSNSIRLLALPEHMLEGLKRGDITEGHARTLLMLKDKPDEQEVVYREILLKKLSVREVERIARKIAKDKVRKQEYKDADAHLIEIEREFTDALGTRVQILKTDFGGKLTIDYFSEDDLDTLLKAMKSQNMKIAAAAMEALSPEATSLGETVIREMDNSHAHSVDALEASTPLEMVEPTADESLETNAANIDQEPAEIASEETGSESVTTDQPSQTDDSTTKTHSEAASFAPRSVHQPETPSDEQGEPGPSSVAEPSPSAGTDHSSANQADTTAQSAPEVPKMPESAELSPAAEVPTFAPTHARPAEAVTSSEETIADQSGARQAAAPAAETVSSDAQSKEIPMQSSESVPAPESIPDNESSEATSSTAAPVADGGAAPTQSAVSSEQGDDSYNSLRARLEAELARLDAQDKAAGKTPVTTESATPESPDQAPIEPVEESAPKKPTDSVDDDDQLYSMKNFSI